MTGQWIDDAVRAFRYLARLWGATQVLDRRELLETGAVRIVFEVVISREDSQEAVELLKPGSQRWKELMPYKEEKWP